MAIKLIQFSEEDIEELRDAMPNINIDVKLVRAYKVKFRQIDASNITFVDIFLFCRPLLLVKVSPELQGRLREFYEQFRDLDVLDDYMTAYNNYEWLKIKAEMQMMDCVKGRKAEMRRLIHLVMGVL